jgi:hypothetical protein
MSADGGSEAGVRRAAAADLPALDRMPARAFDDDPVARYACPADEQRPWMLEASTHRPRRPGPRPRHRGSSKERNLDYYARFGFRVIQELRLSRGPLVGLM